MMFHFILAVVTSAMVSVFMRLSEKHVQNNITMLACNYLMCSLLSLAYTQNLSVFPNVSGLGLTLGLGVINGVFYLSGFVMLNWNIRKNGVVLSAMFMKLGVVVPTLMAIFIFGETPAPLQVAGIVAALAAIVLIRFEKGQNRAASSTGLVALVLAGGMADGMSKVFEVYGNASLNDQFLLYTFLTALILCVSLAVIQKQSISLRDVLFGFLIGIPNYLTARFLLLSLKTIPAIVAYPCYSVGAIVLVTLSGVVFFREKLSRRQVISMVVILAALALLNL